MASNRIPAGHFNLLYFAAASSYTKRNSEHWPAPVQSNELFQALEEKYPGIMDKVLVACALTVNLEYVDMDEAAIEIKEDSLTSSSQCIADSLARGFLPTMAVLLMDFSTSAGATEYSVVRACPARALNLSF